MASFGNILFSGRSGSKYRFHVWPLETRFKPLAGVYFVTRRVYANRNYRVASHEGVYIGQTSNLAALFETEAMLQRFRKHGANCICVCPIADEGQRLATEQDLLASNRTPCND